MSLILGRNMSKCFYIKVFNYFFFKWGIADRLVSLVQTIACMLPLVNLSTDRAREREREYNQVADRNNTKVLSQGKVAEVGNQSSNSAFTHSDQAQRRTGIY